MSGTKWNHMKVSTHTHICIKIHKVIALEHKEMNEDHEPTKEYSYNHKRSQRLEKIKRGGSKYLKERWAYWPYTYTETSSDKPVKQMDLVR